jgi:hypothetical protein
MTMGALSLMGARYIRKGRYISVSFSKKKPTFLMHFYYFRRKMFLLKESVLEKKIKKEI